MPDYCAHLVELLSVRSNPIKLSCAESAELLLGSSSLSQRAYKGMKKALKKKDVFLASYKATVAHVKTLDVGRVSSATCGLGEGCMCATSDFKQTMSLVMACKELYGAMTFPTPDQSVRLLQSMCDKFPSLYRHSLQDRPENRVLLIRETGDNFRGAGRRKIQQDSFSILNLKSLITSPLGQFINGLWRGPESRKYLKGHLSGTYQELDDCVRNGLAVTLPDGRMEVFNVVVFYVADLAHKTEVLGRTSTTAKYGCLHCKKPVGDWAKLSPPAQVLTTQEMIRHGREAQQKLGETPNKDSAVYTSFHQSHFGQTGTPLLSCFPAECNLACALHTILSLHRQLWKHVDHIADSRAISKLLGPALRSAGCDYMAFQMESYYASKKKYYDGSDTLRMTGEDCRTLELNIGKFVQVRLCS